MKGFTLALAAGAALVLAGCGGGTEEATESAAENLEAVAEETASNLQDLSADIMNADQANVLVNESLELQNAADAVENAGGADSNAQ